MISKRLLTGLAAVAALATFALPANAAASKQALVGPEASVFCSDVQPVPGEDVSLLQGGFVVFNQSDGMVSAVVSVKGGLPNTTYVVRLIQGNGGDCFTVDGTFVTNGQGNGNLHVREVIANPNSDVQVIVDTGVLFITPTYRGFASYHLN